MVALASLCIHLVVVMGACCELLLRKGLDPCLWATSICCFLALKSGESSAIYPQYILEIRAVVYGRLCQLLLGRE